MLVALTVYRKVLVSIKALLRCTRASLILFFHTSPSCPGKVLSGLGGKNTAAHVALQLLHYVKRSCFDSSRISMQDRRQACRFFASACPSGETMCNISSPSPAHVADSCPRCLHSLTQIFQLSGCLPLYLLTAHEPSLFSRKLSKENGISQAAHASK